MENKRYISNKRGQKKFGNIFSFSKFIGFMFLFKFIFADLMAKNEIRKLDDYFSEINLVVQGSGEKQVICNDFSITPSGVLINGIPLDTPSKRVTLEGDRNNVTLRFNIQLESCYQMFSDLVDIIEIDLSNFDCSKVTSMYWMFRGCSNLVTINFKNINTNSVKIMRGLFQGCISLTSIDLSNFNTSNVENMFYMFANCKKLEYLDLSNFDTSNVQICHICLLKVQN